MTFLVTDTALHRDALPEHLADRLAERLRSVDDEQHPLRGIQTTVDQIGEQRLDDGGVLGISLPQPKRHLDTLGRDLRARRSSSDP